MLCPEKPVHKVAEAEYIGYLRMFESSTKWDTWMTEKVLSCSQKTNRTLRARIGRITKDKELVGLGLVLQEWTILF